MADGRRSIVVFDLGGVLIDWNPRYLYRKLFAGDEAAMEHFLATVCTQDWNEQQDAGRAFAEACAPLIARHPERAPLILAWGQRFAEMMAGPIHGTVDILEELHAAGVPLYALTNWSAETFPHAQERFAFLERFRGIVVSGHEKMIKPDPRIYRLLLERHAIAAADAIYIDDNPRNAAAATALGLQGIHFSGPEPLRAELRRMGLLAEVPPAPGG
jgi:2-haloacid dehalogenase